MSGAAVLPPLDVDRVLAARHRHGLIAIFDFDGTLAPIVATPDLARVPPSTRGALERMARRADSIVGIVSGRPLAQVSRLVGARGLWLAGVHGAVRRRPGGVVERQWSDDVRRAGARVGRALARELAGLPGVLLEPKGPVLAVHTRAASPTARTRVTAAVRALCPEGWTVLEGRRVAELRPRGLPTKADAVRWIAAARPSAVVLYVGDDATDEDAFRALRARDFPVLVDAARAHAERAVSPSTTAARFSLPNPRAVHGLVARLAAAPTA